MRPDIGCMLYAPPEPGGIYRYTVELLEALERTGTPAQVLYAGRQPAQRPSTRLRSGSLLPGLITLGQIELGWRVRQTGVRLFHDPTGVAPVMFTGGRKIATIHDVIPYIYPETSSRLDWLIYRCWLPFAVRQLDAVITVSQQSRADIVRYLPIEREKVVVIPEAAHSRYRQHSAEEIAPVLARHAIDFPYILYVGSVEARKNLPRLLEAYAQLLGWSTNWKLVIVGARKWRASPVYETVARLGLHDQVHFTGYVEEEDLPALYAGASLFTFPSIYEGFGLPLLEAMACGTPVVTSSTSSLPEVAGDAAQLVDPYDVAAITAAMRKVLDSPELAADMRQRGLARARQFTWERTARETIAVYERVLGRALTPDRGAAVGERTGPGLSSEA